LPKKKFLPVAAKTEDEEVDPEMLDEYK